MKRESAEFGFLGKRAKKGIFTAESAEDAENTNRKYILIEDGRKVFKPQIDAD